MINLFKRLVIKILDRKKKLPAPVVHFDELKKCSIKFLAVIGVSSIILTSSIVYHNYLFNALSQTIVESIQDSSKVFASLKEVKKQEEKKLFGADADSPTVASPFINVRRYFGCQTDGTCDVGTTSRRINGFYQKDLPTCNDETQTINYNIATGKFTCKTDNYGTGGALFSGIVDPLLIDGDGFVAVEHNLDLAHPLVQLWNDNIFIHNSLYPSDGVDAYIEIVDANTIKVDYATLASLIGSNLGTLYLTVGGSGPQGPQGTGVETSTTNYFTYYQSNTSVTGTPALTLGLDGIVFTTATGAVISSTQGYFHDIDIPETGSIDVWGLNSHGVANMSAMLIGGGITIDQAQAGSLGLSLDGGTVFANLDLSAVTANRTFYLSDTDGTFAFTDVAGQVFTPQQTFQSGIKFGSTAMIDEAAGGQVSISNGTDYGPGIGVLFARLNVDNLTTVERQYDFPDESGTFALRENSQTFGGTQTFNDLIFTNATGTVLNLTDLTVQNTISFQNGASITEAALGQVTVSNGTPNNGARLSTDLQTNERQYDFPDASGMFALLDSGEIQNWNALNNFSDITFLNATGTLLVLDNSTPLYLTASSTGILDIAFDNGGYGRVYAGLDFSQITTNGRYIFPDIGGAFPAGLTFAFLDYQGQHFTGYQYFDSGLSTSGGLEVATGQIIFANDGRIASVVPNQVSIGQGLDPGGGEVYANLNTDLINSVSREFTFPDADGTFALTSDLGLYLPLAGGTLSGGLIFTTASGTIITSTAINFVTANGTSITSTNNFSTNFTGTNSVITNATSTNLSVSSLGSILQLGINSSSPVAQLGITGVSTRDPVRVNSSTGAQLFAVKTNGQVVVGPNSLSQTGQLTVETPTTNDIALSFTNGTHYTFQLGRVAGSSGQTFIGGPSGTVLNLRANGTDQVFIRTGGFVGIGSSTPNYNLTVTGTVGFANLGTDITGNGVCRTTAGRITDAGAAACVPSALKYKTNVTPYEKSATELFTELVKAGAVENYELKTKMGDSRKGLIADIVEKVDPDLVGYSDDGSVNTLHFEDITGLSVKAIAELNTRVTELEKKVAVLEETKTTGKQNSNNASDWIQWILIAGLGVLVIKKRI